LTKTVTKSGNRTFVSYKKFEYVDYTLNAIENKFNFHILAKIDAIEYQSRLIKFSKAKKLIGAGQILLVSYEKVDLNDSGVQAIISRTSSQMISPIDKFVFMTFVSTRLTPRFDKIDVQVTNERTVYVDDNNNTFEL